MAVKSISRSMSDSVFMTSLPAVTDVWKRFSISLSLEKERCALLLVIIKTKYIFSAIATLGKVSRTPLSIISLYKNSSVLMFLGSSSLTISANLAKWHSSSTNKLSRSFVWQLSVAFLGIMLKSNQSSQTDQPVAYKLVGVGLEKQWTGRWNWGAEPRRVPHMHAQEL